MDTAVDQQVTDMEARVAAIVGLRYGKLAADGQGDLLRNAVLAALGIIQSKPVTNQTWIANTLASDKSYPAPPSSILNIDPLLPDTSVTVTAYGDLLTLNTDYALGWSSHDKGDVYTRITRKITGADALWWQTLNGAVVVHGRWAVTAAMPADVLQIWEKISVLEYRSGGLEYSAEGYGDAVGGGVSVPPQYAELLRPLYAYRKPLPRQIRRMGVSG